MLKIFENTHWKKPEFDQVGQRIREISIEEEQRKKEQKDEEEEGFRYGV